MPGILGFIPKKNQPHSNHSSLYLTLAPLPLFNRKYSETARILSSTLPFLPFSDPAQQNSLKIVTVTPLSTYHPQPLLRKRNLLCERSPFFPENLEFKSEAAILELTESIISEKKERGRKFLAGPKSLSFEGIESSAALLSIQELPLGHVQSLSFIRCRLDFDFFRVFSINRNFLPQLKSISLEDMKLTQQTLSHICKLELDSLSLTKIRLAESRSLFQFLCLHSSFFKSLKKLKLSLALTPPDLHCLRADLLESLLEAEAKASKNHSSSAVQSQSQSKSRSKGRQSSSKKDRSTASKDRKGKSGVLGVRSSLSKDGGTFVRFEVDVGQALADLSGFGVKLEELDLSGNQIFDEGLELVLSALPRNVLKKVNLKDTGVTSKGILHIFIFLNLSYIRYIVF